MDRESAVWLIAGKYEVVREIGRGGTASVYEATNRWSRRRVAVKVLHLDLAAEVALEERFSQEARTAASLTHPNIVSILDFGREEDGSLYLVQEYLEGEDFGAYLARRGRLSIGRTWGLLAPVMDALAHAHETGVLHRDIKPQNIFIVRGLLGEAIPKVVDFGIAKVLLDDEGVRTPTGLLVGTPQYMSPEVLVGKRDAGPAGDVWAMAVTLYEALAGHPPYDGSSIVEVATKVIDGAFAPLAEHVPNAPRALDDFFWSALHRDPARRFPTMSALAESFRRAARDAIEEAAGDTERISRDEVAAVLRDVDDGVEVPRSDVLMLPRPTRSAPKTDPAPPPIDEKEHKRRARFERASPQLGTPAVMHAPAASAFDSTAPTTQPGVLSTRVRAGLVVTANDLDDPRIVRPFRSTFGNGTSVSRFRTYVELVDALADGDVDVAWLPPVAYLRARKRGVASLLVGVQRAGSASYASALLVRTGSYRDLASLRGTRAVWVDPWSAAGYLVPRMLLRSRGVDPDAAFRSQGFVGSYDAVLESLRAHTAEVGPSFCSVDAAGSVVRAGWGDAADVEPIAVSAPIPSDLLCASSTLPAHACDEIRQVLVALAPDAPLLRLVGGTAFVPAVERSYDALADALTAEGT